GRKESGEGLRVVCVGPEGVGRAAAGAQVAEERGDGRDHRTVIIQQFDPKFAVSELLRDAHAGLLNSVGWVVSLGGWTPPWVGSQMLLVENILEADRSWLVWRFPSW